MTDSGKKVFSQLEGTQLLHACLKYLFPFFSTTQILFLFSLKVHDFFFFTNRYEKRARIAAIRALDFCCSHAKMAQKDAQENCHQFIDAGGLGIIFTLFGKCRSSSSSSTSAKVKEWRKKYKGIYNEKEDLGIISFLFLSLLNVKFTTLCFC